MAPQAMSVLCVSLVILKISPVDPRSPLPSSALRILRILTFRLSAGVEGALWAVYKELGAAPQPVILRRTKRETVDPPDVGAARIYYSGAL